jgi:hypothetical protein
MKRRRNGATGSSYSTAFLPGNAMAEHWRQPNLLLLFWSSRISFFPRYLPQHGLLLSGNGARNSRRWMGCVRHHDRVVLQLPLHKGVARRKPLALAVVASFAYQRLYAQILCGSWDRLHRQSSRTPLSRDYGMHGFSARNHLKRGSALNSRVPKKA